MNLSKNQLKTITGLTQKKYRKKHNLFVVEGIKAVDEFLSSNQKLKYLFYTDENTVYSQIEIAQLIKEADLERMSSLKTPNKVLAVFEIPAQDDIIKSGLVLALDSVNDPGNLGTIIRLCDWFGVDQLVCSETTVDCHNPKVVQASMGSLTRVSIVYTNLNNYLRDSNAPVMAADMNGENVYKKNLPENAVLVMGNEANGISNSIAEYVNEWIKIPRFGLSNNTESLNVATASGILLSEFRRLH